jgi:hypothetical protein
VRGYGKDLVSEEGHDIGEGVGREMKMDAVRFQAVDAVADTAHISHIEVEVQAVNGMFATGVVKVVDLVLAGDGVGVIQAFVARAVEVVVLVFVTGRCRDSGYRGHGGVWTVGDGAEVTTVFGCVDGVERLNIAKCCGP